MCTCPDLDEGNKFIAMLREGKSSGADGLHPEVVKRGDRRLFELLYTIIKDVWKNLEVLVDRKDAQLDTIFIKENMRLR